VAKLQTVNWTPNYGTAQIYSSGAQVALSNPDGDQIGPFVWCKDFLHDALRAALWGTDSSIYSYRTGKAEREKINLERPYVLLANNSNPSQEACLPAMKEFMNQVDAAVGVAKPSFYRIAANPPAEYKSGVSYWVGDPLWMISPPAFSLWTLLLRNAHVHKMGDNYMTTIDNLINGKVQPGVRNDGMYLTYGIEGLKLLVEKGIANVFNNGVPMPTVAEGALEPKAAEFKAWFSDRLKTNYPDPKVVGTSTLHHWFGIVSWSDNSMKKYVSDAMGWLFPKTDKVAPSVCHA
jgi:hypothetical protein